MKVVTKYRCERCRSTYATEAEARKCEAQPTAAEALQRYPPGLIWGSFYPRYSKLYLQINWKPSGPKRNHYKCAEAWRWAEVPAGEPLPTPTYERFVYNGPLGYHDGLAQHPPRLPGDNYHLQHPAVLAAVAKAHELGLTPTWWDGFRAQPFPAGSVPKKVRRKNGPQIPPSGLFCGGETCPSTTTQLK